MSQTSNAYSEDAAKITQLDYEAPRKRKWFRLFVLAAAVIAGSIALLHFRKPLLSWVLFQRELRFWNTESVPADRIMYEEDFALVDALRKSLKEYSTFRGKFLFDSDDGKPAPGWKPPAVFQFAADQSIRKVFPIYTQCAFGGAVRRSDRTGKQWLIMLDYGCPSFCSTKYGHTVTLLFRAAKAGMWTLRAEPSKPPRAELGFVLNKAESLRLFTIRIDPKKPDCFTLRYEINSKPGTIEGRITYEGIILLKLPDGPANRYRITGAYGQLDFVDKKKPKSWH